MISVANAFDPTGLASLLFGCFIAINMIILGFVIRAAGQAREHAREVKERAGELQALRSAFCRLRAQQQSEHAIILESTVDALFQLESAVVYLLEHVPHRDNTRLVQLRVVLQRIGSVRKEVELVSKARAVQWGDDRLVFAGLQYIRSYGNHHQASILRNRACDPELSLYLRNRLEAVARELDARKEGADSGQSTRPTIDQQ